jgi:crossover junction endodeoxyribonuclease RuvC
LKVLGIDPGYALLGFGIIEQHGNKSTPITYGVIETKAGEPFVSRLGKIYKQTRELILKHQPDVISIETLYFSKNTKTAMNVAHARGVVLAVAADLCNNVHEYSPVQIKQALTGYGRASKQQMQAMITSLLNLKTIPKPDDAADALAIALCHINTNQYAALER